MPPNFPRREAPPGLPKCYPLAIRIETIHLYQTLRKALKLYIHVYISGFNQLNSNVMLETSAQSAFSLNLFLVFNLFLGVSWCKIRKIGTSNLEVGFKYYCMCHFHHPIPFPCAWYHLTFLSLLYNN